MKLDARNDKLPRHGTAERPVRAFVLHIEFKAGKFANDASAGGRSAATRLEETIGLARAIDLEIVGSSVAPLIKPSPGTLLGSGKVAELARLVAEQEIELVIVDAQLSPVQQRNLERAWQAKVLDRTALILEIFGRRARTREGALQVELAHLVYQKSRLVRSWTHLERQRGGFGFLGGPGESQLEIDRRIIGERIDKIERELEAVRNTRALHRKGRGRVPFPVVALVGYTNAGKSTLFNALTSADVLAENLLFATLDPTMREVVLPHGRKIILSDTVGFISALPTTLVAAFRATLEEVLEADLILHVRDVSHAETKAQAQDVANVLHELGIDDRRQADIIEVWNKADLLPPDEHLAQAQKAARSHQSALVSAVTGEGLDRLLSLIEDRLAASLRPFLLSLDPEEGEALAWLYRHGEVLSRRSDPDGGIDVTVRLDAKAEGLARARFGDRLKPESRYAVKAAAE